VLPAAAVLDGCRATGIAPFVVGFVLTPLASNSSEFVSSLTFAARKKRKNMSLTLSQVGGARKLLQRPQHSKGHTSCTGHTYWVCWKHLSLCAAAWAPQLVTGLTLQHHHRVLCS
jgi:hypothetical protein